MNGHARSRAHSPCSVPVSHQERTAGVSTETHDRGHRIRTLRPERLRRLAGGTRPTRSSSIRDSTRGRSSSCSRREGRQARGDPRHARPRRPHRGQRRTQGGISGCTPDHRPQRDRRAQRRRAQPERARSGSRITSPPPDRLVDDGETLEVAGFTFEVREIPGHSPGSVVFVCTDLRSSLRLRRRRPVRRLDRSDGPGGQLRSAHVRDLRQAAEPARRHAWFTRATDRPRPSGRKGGPIPSFSTSPGRGPAPDEQNQALHERLGDCRPAPVVCPPRSTRAVRGEMARPCGQDRGELARAQSSPETWCSCPATSRWPAPIATSSPISPGWIGLPGTKVLSAGNHDAWWNGTDQVRPLLRRSLLAVGGDALEIGGVIVCGTRGAPPATEDLPPEQQAVVDHELGELDRALEHAGRLRTDRRQPLYVLWHYPPFDSYGRPGPWVSRFEQAGVSVCVYGHLHTEGQWARRSPGTVRRGPLLLRGRRRRRISSPSRRLVVG